MKLDLPPAPDPFLDALPGRRLWVRAFGRWRRGYLDRVASNGYGKTATVWVSTDDGREHRRRVDPVRHGAALAGEWREEAARSFGFAAFGALVKTPTVHTEPLLGDRLWRPRPFLAGALLNAVDVALMRAGAALDQLADRGGFPWPNVVPWSKPWTPSWSEEGS